MTLCWDCGQPRRSELAPCETCGASAMQHSTKSFMCTKCAKSRTGARIVTSEEVICARCWLGENEHGDTPNPMPEKRTWPKRSPWEAP